MDTQERFHRYVALLFSFTIPVLGVVELTRGIGSPLAVARVAGFVALGSWAVYIALKARPKAVLLVLATMTHGGVLVVVESLSESESSAFDFATTFGALTVLSVLAGTLVTGNRMIWGSGIAGMLATWVIVVGALEGEVAQVVAGRAVVAAAGVLATTTLVSKLLDQLSEAIVRHDRSARLQDAIARCSEALLVQKDAFATYEAVRALLEASDADYAYIDRTIEVDGEPGWEMSADAAKRAAGYGSARRRGMYSEIPSTYEMLLEGQAAVVHTGTLQGRERKFYADAGILSEVAVPIFVAGVLRGTIGFVAYTDDTVWSDAEIQTLWRASHMIGSYWGRQDYAQELRASNESKERLLASVSHEIRTPLTAIVGLSEEINASRSSLGPEELNELNEIIAVQSRELAELVEDLLVASRADFGNLSIKPEMISLHDQVSRVLDGVRESHRTEKRVEAACKDVLAWADPLRVRQILRNLLTNAIKYGGDRIVVEAHCDGNASYVMVTDNGPGIPTHESDLIFERYYRSAESPTKPGSVGIGLAVSRQLAEMMEGSLRYVSEGSESRFELELPFLSAAPATGVEKVKVGNY